MTKCEESYYHLLAYIDHTMHINSTNPAHIETTACTALGVESRLAPLPNPSCTELVATASIVVDTDPAESVTSNVTTVGAGVISGIALTFIVGVAPNTGLYVLAPNSEASRSPMEAGTEVLNV